MEKRLAAINIIQTSLNYTEKDCYLRSDELLLKGDWTGWNELLPQLMAISNLATKLGMPLGRKPNGKKAHGNNYPPMPPMPLSTKLDEKQAHGLNLNTMLATLRQLHHTPLEHGCPVGTCKHKSLHIVAAQTDAKGVKAASQKAGKKEEKFVFDPVGRILERLSSSDAWEEQGSTLGWGFGLLNDVKVETKSEKAEDVAAGNVLKRKRI